MKKVKLDYRHTDKRSRTIATSLKTMFKIETVTILVLVVLAHQIHGIYSQGKREFRLKHRTNARRIECKWGRRSLCHLLLCDFVTQRKNVCVASQARPICWHILQRRSNVQFRITQWTTSQRTISWINRFFRQDERAQQATVQLMWYEWLNCSCNIRSHASVHLSDVQLNLPTEMHSAWLSHCLDRDQFWIGNPVFAPTRRNGTHSCQKRRMQHTHNGRLHQDGCVNGARWLSLPTSAIQSRSSTFQVFHVQQFTTATVIHRGLAADNRMALVWVVVFEKQKEKLNVCFWKVHENAINLHLSHILLDPAFFTNPQSCRLQRWR